MARWQRTLYILVLVQFVSATGFSSTFSFQPLYIAELGTRTGLSIEFLSGLVFSAPAITQIIMSPFWGAIADRRGRKLMVERATFGGAAVIFLMTFVGSAEEFVLLRAVQGLITGVVAAMTALVAANVPRERAGYALGLLQVGLWGGISAGPLIGGLVADTFGYRSTFLITSGMLLISGVLAWRGVDEQFQPRPRPVGRRYSFWAAWRQVLARPGIGSTYTADFMSQLGRFMLVPFLPFLVEDLMSGREQVATVTGIVSAVSALTGTLAAVYLGRLGDRIGPRIILLYGALAAAVFHFPQGLVWAVWQLITLQAITGAILGGITPAISAALAHCTPSGEEGAVYGLENSIAATARAIAPLLGSALVVWVDLWGVFATAGIIFLLMAVIVFGWLPGKRGEG